MAKERPYLNAEQYSEVSRAVIKKRAKVVSDAMIPIPEREKDVSHEDYVESLARRQKKMDTFDEMRKSLDLSHDKAQMLLELHKFSGKSNTWDVEFTRKTKKLAKLYGMTDAEAVKYEEDRRLNR